MTGIEIKPSVRRRFEYIEFQLNWEGSVGRKKLKDQLQISLQQATNDLNAYLDLFPGNMLYDPRQKAYVPSPDFRPRLTSGRVTEYLMQLDMLQKGYRSVGEIWVGSLPTFDVVSTINREIDPGTFKCILSAIREGHRVEARYISLSSDNVEPRVLLPHAIGSDGHRWHVRAFDFAKDRYSDFVLSRLDVSEILSAPEQQIREDTEWNVDVEIVLRPETGLTKQKRDRLELEYGMTDGRLSLKVRQAMLWYYLRHYGFNPDDIDGAAFRNKSSFHLQVSNLKEVEKCLGRRG